MIQQATRTDPTHTNHNLLAERAYQALRQRIIGGELRPGAAIIESDLAVALGISRTPVREALRRLDEEGLVRLLPHRGAYVALLSSQDVEEIFQVREMLEGLAARLAAERLSDAAATEVDGLLDRFANLSAASDMQEIFAADNQFHACVLRLGGNDLARRMLEKLSGQVHRIRVISASAPSRIPESIEEHRQVLRAIRDREPDLAEQLMRHHVRRTHRNAEMMRET